MADQTLPMPGLRLTAPRAARPLLEWLHDWVITVDHKRLGILYIVYSLFFLLVGGVEAISIRIQLAVPNNHFLSPEIFNQLLHHARHHDGLSRGHADSLRLRAIIWCR